MKRKIKALIVILFSLVFCAGCIKIIPISSFGDSSSSSGGETVAHCSLVTPESDSSAKENTGFISKLLAMKPSEIFKANSKSTVVVAACYVVNNEDKQMLTSGFVFDKEETKNANGNYTYYVMTNASGIFYRYIPTDITSFTDVASSTQIARSGEFEITLEDGRCCLSSLVGYYDNFDVAIFKFETPEIIPVVTMGNSDELEVGEAVTAIGTPIVSSSLINTCVAGNVSGLHRTTDVLFEGTIGTRNYSGTVASYPTFQFDAPINGGMEGGPVFNEQGEVVGMMSYKYKGDTNYESLSMAIASNDLINIADSLIKNGSYSKPILGVTVGDVLNYQNHTACSWIGTNGIYQGLYVVTKEINKEDGIATGSAAAKAGMVSNVVITKIVVNGTEKEIINLSHLSSILVQLKKGDTVKLVTINSSMETKTYTLNLWS